MGKKRKRPKKKTLKNILCVFMCALVFFQTAEPSAGAAAPPGVETYESQDAVSLQSNEEGITTQPVMDMTGRTYEGHKVIISDVSLYRIDGHITDTKDLYEANGVWMELLVTDGRGQNAEDVVDIRQGKCEKNQREAVFSVPGNYGVEMVLHIADAKQYSVKQRINVEKAPQTTSALIGAQKQYRLQRIDYKTAQNPSYPLQNASLTIMTADGSEQAGVEIVKDGQAVNKMSAASHIMLRNAAGSFSEDKFFYNGSVEFMSTLQNEAGFKYKIEAEDSRGRKYVYDSDFNVVTDEPPVAAIDISDTYTREENSDEAVITVEDITQTDGDTVERQWYVRYEGSDKYRPLSGEQGYADLSDGKKAKVSFRKKGTGVFYIKLKATDVWSEGTMDEYTSALPRLSDTAERRSEVVNIAPHITLGAHSLKSADIIVVSGKDDDWSSLKQKFSEKFLAKGTEVHFAADKADLSRADGGYSDYTEKFGTESAFGYYGADSTFENDLYIVDNSNLYYMEASWSDPDRGHPEEPFTIIARDGESGDELWHYVLTSDVFALNTSKAHMYQDDTEKYLYITSPGKTLVILKSTGQPVNIIDYEVGEYNYVYDDTLYTFKNDGIYRISLKDGSTSAVWRGTISGAVRRVSGIPVTYIKTAQETVLKLSLDIYSGKAETKYVGKLKDGSYIQFGEQYGNNYTMNVVGIDVNGRAIVEINTPIYNEGVSATFKCYRIAIQVYDPDGTLVKQIVKTNDSRMNAIPVIDKNGAFNYIAIASSGRRVLKVDLSGIENDHENTLSLSDSNGSPAYYNRLIYSWESDGKVWVTLGGACVWIYNNTWANGPQHGYPERCTNICFDLSSGQAAEVSLPAGCTGFSEYARSSDLYTAVHTARNCQFEGSAKVDNKVTKRSQSAYNMLYRIMKKNMRADSGPDHKILLFKDMDAGAPISEKERQSLGSLAEAAGYTVYETGKGSSAVSTLISGAEYIRSDEDLAEAIAEKISDENVKNHSCTSVAAASDDARVKRIMTLKPNSEYYFEYSVKADKEPSDPVSISHSILPVLNENTYDDDTFYVTGFEIEDFNDSELNDFFTYGEYASAGGMYTDCRKARPIKTNVYIERDSEIKFTIDKGKKGVLSFDYIIFNNNDAHEMNANYAEIDGQRWERVPGKAGNGSYTHPYILEEGEHTLKLHTAAYGGRILNYTYIDNLKLSYVSKDRSYSNAASMIYDKSSAKNSDGAYKITGRFYTPGDATCYREMKGIEYVSGAAGTAKYTRIETGEDDQTFYIDLPDGKSAVSAWTELITNCVGDYNVTYNMGDLIEARYFGKLRSDSYKLTAITTPWRYIFPSLTGSYAFKTYFDSYRHTSGSFGDVDMYIADAPNLLTEGDRYIKENNAEGEKTLFLGEKGYGDKTEIVLNIDKSVKELYDFRLYTIEEGKRVYVSDNDLTDRDTLKKWTAENADIKYTEQSSANANDIPVFSKGQYVNYNVTYWDYEGDPSKKSYWKYTHTPYNDGAFEQADTVLDRDGNILSEHGIILNEPVTRFYKDGKYTVEHWQEDDTTRGAVPDGDPAYDKESNHVFITFYVGSMEDAPWIRYIKAIPSEAYEGDDISLEIGVDDAKKSELTLETEVYRGDELVYTGRVADIAPENGAYAPVKINGVKNNAPCGIYRVTCTVSSVMGTGAETIRFTVMSRGNIEGNVYHTDKWDENRKIAGREKDVFWPGEKIMLKADVEGSPVKVTAWIDGEDDGAAELSPAESGVYRGMIWNEDMMFRWGTEPLDKKIIFKAEYNGGTVKMSEYSITFDNSRLYWNIHKTQGA